MQSQKLLDLCLDAIEHPLAMGVRHHVTDELSDALALLLRETACRDGGGPHADG